MVDLEFLTDKPHVQEVCRRYWALDEEGQFVGTVSTLADEVGYSSADLLNLVRASCRVTVTSLSCEGCGKGIEVTSRTDYATARRRYRHQCDDCLQRAREGARKAEQEAQDRRLESVQATFGYPIPPPPSFEELSLEEAVYFLSLVRTGASEDMRYIKRIVDFETPLTPWRPYDLEVLDILRKAKLVDIHPGSHEAAFSFENDRLQGYYPNNVHWRILVSESPVDTRSYIHDLEQLFREMNWPDHWTIGSTELWRKVARYECIEYLSVSLSEHRIPFEPGERSISVIDGLLESFSVSEIYNMIWRKTRDAAAFLSRTPASRDRGADYAVVSLQKFGDKAKSEGWKLTHYRRSWELPVSMVAEVLYNMVLQTDGFNVVPR